MKLSKFNALMSLSNEQILEAIFTNEKKLFKLQFKKATRQSFKSHEIKETKRHLAQLNTLLTFRLKLLYNSNIEYSRYMIKN
jgi:ribosomal protein L29